jgi:hypothetical protein
MARIKAKPRDAITARYSEKAKPVPRSPQPVMPRMYYGTGQVLANLPMMSKKKRSR